jgi:hypothetical protein
MARSIIFGGLLTRMAKLLMSISKVSERVLLQNDSSSGCYDLRVSAFAEWGRVVVEIDRNCFLLDF